MEYTKPDIQGAWEQSGTIIFVGGPHGAVICQMAEPRRNTFVEFHPLELGSKDWDEQMANARLISKSPALVEALVRTQELLKKVMLIEVTNGQVREVYNENAKLLASVEGK